MLGMWRTTRILLMLGILRAQRKSSDTNRGSRSFVHTYTPLFCIENEN